MKKRMFGNGLLLDHKALQRDVEVSRSQAETPKYVGYIVYDLGVLDCKYIYIYIGICLYVSLPWQYDRTTFTIYLVLGPAPALM